MTSVITATIYYDPSEALVVSSFLEANGIVNFIPDLYLTTNTWHLTQAWNGIRIWVLETSLEETKELLKPQSLPSEHQKQQRKALKPDLIHPKIKWFDLLIAITATVFFSVPMPVWRRRKRATE